MKYFRILIYIFFAIFINIAYAFAPQSGLWIVADELDGKPGRGLSIDVQGKVFVVAVWAYERSGAPVFYIGNNQLDYTNSGSPAVSVQLSKLNGGRYFGGPAQSGYSVGSAGAAYFRFTSGYTGYVAFPGEPEKFIIRYNFGYSWGPDSLYGGWSFTSATSAGYESSAYLLSRAAGKTSYGNGIVSTQDGSFGCEHQTSGAYAWLVLCVRVDQSGNIIRVYAFDYSINEGEGRMGIGSTQPNLITIVRRLTLPSGEGTGIVLRNDKVSDVTDDFLSRAFVKIQTSGFSLIPEVGLTPN